MLKRSLGWILSAALVMACALSGLAQPYVMDADTVGRYGGEIRVAALSDPRTFNPYLAKETSSTDVINGHIFEPLLGRNGVTTEHEPRLARTWEFSEDGLVWTFYLR